MRAAVGLLLLGAVLALFGATWAGADQATQRTMLVTATVLSLALLGLDYIGERRGRR